MEFIQKIEIENYKSIKHLVIEDCKRVNLFIGYPNVGKSNILEALSLISCNTNKQNLSKLCRYNSYFNLFHLGEINYPIKVNINNVLFLDLIFNHEKPFDFSLIKKLPNADMLAIGHESNFGYNNIKKYNFIGNSDVKSSDVKYLSIPNGSNLLDIFLINKVLRNEAAQILAEYNLKLNIDKEKNEIRVQRNTSEDTIFTIPYSMTADTIQRLLFYNAAILSNENSILLFEEPEAHLFPPFIKKMTTDILSDNRNNQYFINTHSPYVLNNLLENGTDNVSIYIVYFKNEETKVKCLNSQEMKEVLEYDIDLFYNLESFIK